MPHASSSNSVRSPQCAEPVNSVSDASNNFSKNSEVDVLWARIAQATVPTPDADNKVEVNSSLYPCAKNKFQISVRLRDGEQPIHGHRWTLTHPAPSIGGRITEHIHSAAQSPETDCTNQLIDALDSRQGLFEFVSPRAMRGGRSEHGPSIVQMIDQLQQANQSRYPCLGGRYEIVRFRPIKNSQPGSDVVHYELVARDLKTNKLCNVPVTQAGLRFDGRALQKKEILRADLALQNHKQLVKASRPPKADQASSDDNNRLPRHGPLIVSQVGIGRNAALITFSDIRTRILEDRSVDRNNLDQILLEVIVAGRQARGPRFLHTKEQLNVVRQTLLELIEDVAKGDGRKSVARHTSAERESRRRLNRFGDSPKMHEREHQPAPPIEQPTTPAAGLDEGQLNDAEKDPANDAPSQLQVISEASTNVIRPPPDIASFTDESLSQADPTAVGCIASPSTENTVSPLSKTAPSSISISAAAVISTSPPRNIITRQSLAQVAVYALTDEHDPLGRRTIWPLENGQINIKVIGSNLNFKRDPGNCSSGTHFVKGISGVKEGCWWRSVWLSALLQHAYSSRDENALENNIVALLAEHFRPDAHVVTEMIKAIRQDGYFSVVMQDTGGKDQDDEYMRLCELGLARYNTRTTNTVEDILKKLTNALLEAEGCDEQARYPLIADQPGGDELMPTLCHQLQADMVLFVDESDVDTTAQPYLKILACGESPLNYLDVDESLPDPLTNSLMNRLAHLPVITGQGSHFDVAIPRTFNPGRFSRAQGKN